MHECRCYGISKHIHLEEDKNVVLEISDVRLGMGLLETLAGEKEMLQIPPMHYLTKFRVWILVLLEQ